MKRLNMMGWTAMAVIVSLVSYAPAKALVVALPNVGARAIHSPTIVIGSITTIEKEPIQAEPFVNAPNKVGYMVAILKIDETLRGKDGVTHIRIGYIPEPKVVDEPVDDAADVNRPRKLIARVPRRPGFAVRLEEGVQGCFFLEKHHKEDFYIVPNMNIPLFKKDETYAKDLETVKKSLKIVANPVAALKSENADDRRFAASTLLMSYRQVSNPKVENGKLVTEPLSAEESALILKEIVTADWTKFDPKIDALPPQSQFFMLGLTEQDGWQQPKFNGQGNFAVMMQEAAAKWFKEKGNDYRIQRVIPNTTGR